MAENLRQRVERVRLLSYVIQASFVVMGIMATILTVFHTMFPGEDSFEQAPMSEEMSVAVGFLVLGAALLLLFSIFVTGVCWLFWKYTTSSVLRDAGFPMEISPAGACGWYFVPFANLVMPLRAMREIYQRSNPAWHDAAPGGGVYSIVSIWWGLTIGSGFLSRASDRVEMASVEALSGIVLLASIVAAVMVVRKVSENMQQMLERGYFEGAQDVDVFG